MSVNYFSKDGLQKIKDELKDLHTKGRADMAKQIAEARDKGDLSENAEYDAAKDAQGHLEHRIKQLEAIVGDARILDINAVDMSKVGVLSFVRIKNLKNNAEVKYQLVAEEEANLASLLLVVIYRTMPMMMMRSQRYPRNNWQMILDSIEFCN